MATSRMSKVIHQLHSAAMRWEAVDLTDGQLLDAFVKRREQAALEVLVRRHAPMIWSVCRRILDNHHDAEDAFQATFLVLVRKAPSIMPREMVGNWLYGVAQQTARKARTTTAKRQARERQQTAMPETDVTERELWSDLQPLLDKELSLLPDKYRVVIVLCDLEGKTRPETARQLGLPEGTVASRLARARTMLAKRLAPHAVGCVATHPTVSGGMLAAVLSQEAAAGAVPTAVLVSTIKAVTSVAAGQAVAGVISVKVATLAEGVLKTMFLTKLKVASMVLVVMAVAAGGAGGLAYYAQATEPAITQAEAGPKNKKAERPDVKPAEVQADQDAQKRLDRLQADQDAQKRLDRLQADQDGQKRFDRLQADQDAQKRLDRLKEAFEKAQETFLVARTNLEQVRMAYEETKAKVEKLNKQKNGTQKATQGDDEERKQRDEDRKRRDREIEEMKLRQLFHNGDVDIFIDGDTQKPFVKGASFHSVVEMSGRRFLRFARLGSDGRQERLLVDPARIVSVRIPE
jgi:RNA polymerase sigma factor (sigma-70 family)